MLRNILVLFTVLLIACACSSKGVDTEKGPDFGVETGTPSPLDMPTQPSGDDGVETGTPTLIASASKQLDDGKVLELKIYDKGSDAVEEKDANGNVIKSTQVDVGEGDFTINVATSDDKQAVITGNFDGKAISGFNVVLVKMIPSAMQGKEEDDLKLNKLPGVVNPPINIPQGGLPKPAVPASPDPLKPSRQVCVPTADGKTVCFDK